MSSFNSEGIVGLYTHKFHIPKRDTWYTSEKFTIKGITDCDFVIQLSGACGPQISSTKSYRYQVLVKKSNAKSEFAKIAISILGEEITRIVRNWTDICSFTKEASRPYLYHVRVDCQIIWYGTTEDAIPLQASLNPFSGFHNFHSNSSMSDLKISIDGEVLSAHRLVLAAYSPQFLHVFETDMEKNKGSHIAVPGTELEVMKIILSILYTGYDGDLDELEMAEKVLIFAEKYEMKALKRLCEWKIFQKLEISNVIDILDKADNSNARTLRTGCMNFIVKNKEKMAKSEDLKTICCNKPKMMCELLETLMINK